MAEPYTRPPVHEKLTVRAHETLYKNAEWCKTVVLTEGFNRTEVAVYLWKQNDDGWTRKQKLTVRDADEWR